MCKGISVSRERTLTVARGGSLLAGRSPLPEKNRDGGKLAFQILNFNDSNSTFLLKININISIFI
jgi:hypothetical protein